MQKREEETYNLMEQGVSVLKLDYMLQNPQGGEVTLQEVIKGQPSLVVFARHLG